jgi:alkylation response protein AidB-like acyl-CoA dehydrogenase
VVTTPGDGQATTLCRFSAQEELVTATIEDSRERLVSRVADLRPSLEAKAAWTEKNGRLHEETIELLAEAGVFRMRVPRRYGGLESDTRTLVDVATELGRASGSIGWTASVYWIPTWMVGLFPDAVQDEVFATPDVRVCGTLSPSAMASPVPGGIVVNGKWGFTTGARHSHWQEILAVQVSPDAEPMPVMALVPSSELTIVDDWDTSALRGTGSVTTVAQDLFVPQERVVPLPVILQGQSMSAKADESTIHGAPLLPVASASSVGTALGLVIAARDLFLERLPERKITYTDYASQAEAPLTHHQLANASMKIDEAAFHAHRLADTVDSKTAAGEQWSLQERVAVRADMGAAVRLAKEAVDLFATASGGSSVYTSHPMRGIQQDVQAISLHALMNPDTNAELYGRTLCGLPPNTLYI